MKKHFKVANKGWSDPAWEPELTRYEYVKKLADSGVQLNVSPTAEGAVPATVSYWEEPMVVFTP